MKVHGQWKGIGRGLSGAGRDKMLNNMIKIQCVHLQKNVIMKATIVYN